MVHLLDPQSETRIPSLVAAVVALGGEWWVRARLQARIRVRIRIRIWAEAQAHPANPLKSSALEDACRQMWAWRALDGAVL